MNEWNCETVSEGRGDFNLAAVELPRDLSGWLEEPALIRLTLEAADSLGWKYPGAHFHGHDGLSYRPEMLMLLLTYCYVIGFKGSNEIEAAVQRDTTLRYIVGRVRPDANVLQRFRRRHRGMIVQTLAVLLERLWDLQAEARDGQSYFQHSSARWRQVPRRPDFQKVAAERVDQAVFLDCILRDI